MNVVSLMFLNVVFFMGCCLRSFYRWICLWIVYWFVYGFCFMDDFECCFLWLSVQGVFVNGFVYGLFMDLFMDFVLCICFRTFVL